MHNDIMTEDAGNSLVALLFSLSVNRLCLKICYLCMHVYLNNELNIDSPQMSFAVPAALAI